MKLYQKVANALKKIFWLKMQFKSLLKYGKRCERILYNIRFGRALHSYGPFSCGCIFINTHWMERSIPKGMKLFVRWNLLTIFANLPTSNHMVCTAFELNYLVYYAAHLPGRIPLYPSCCMVRHNRKGACRTLRFSW